MSLLGGFRADQLVNQLVAEQKPDSASAKKLVDRIKNMIKAGANRVSPKEIENVIAELVELRDRYGFASFMFHDDCLTEDRRWVAEFTKRYREEGFGQSFFCQSRADIIVRHEDMVALMAEVGLGTVGQVRVSGGGARSPVWRQILADVLGVDLVSVETGEGAALGAALLAGVGAGLWPSVEEACAAANVFLL